MVRRRVVHPRDADWDRNFIGLFPEMAGSRQIFDLQIDLVQTSCGSGVPEMQFVRSRGETEMLPYYAAKGPEGMQKYWRKKKNAVSLDGKPTGLCSGGRCLMAPAS